MSTTTISSLDNLLRTDPIVSRVSDLASQNTFLRESLHQILEFSNDVQYVQTAVKVAESFKGDKKGLETTVGTIKEMVLWQLDEGTRYNL